MLQKIIIRLYDSMSYMYHRSAMKLHIFSLKWQRVFRCHKPKKILVVRIASLGDVIRTTAVLKRLHMKYSDAKIDFLTHSSAVNILKNNPYVNNVYDTTQIHELTNYEFIINLQIPDPPANFLDNENYQSILKHITTLATKFICGRYYKNKEVIDTNIFYCSTEMEELFFAALLKYKHRYVDDTQIFLRKPVPQLLPEKQHYLGIFLGANSTGGHDAGLRSYTMSFIDKLIEQLPERFNIVVFGQSSVKTAKDMQEYSKILLKYPKVIDMVDKTNIEELFHLVATMSVVISCDSVPIHICMALNVPVVALYVNAAQFRISPVPSKKYFLINYQAPCFSYNYRWKYFCSACESKHFNMYGCQLKSILLPVDEIPIAKIINAVDCLLNENT